MWTTAFCLSAHLLGGTWIVPTFWLLWTMLLRVWCAVICLILHVIPFHLRSDKLTLTRLGFSSWGLLWHLYSSYPSTLFWWHGELFFLWWCSLWLTEEVTGVLVRQLGSKSYTALLDWILLNQLFDFPDTWTCILVSEEVTCLLRLKSHLTVTQIRPIPVYD